MSDRFEWGSELPRLSGRRIDLRWLEAADAPDLLAIFGDPEVMRFWSSPPLADLAAASKLVDDIQDLFRGRRLFQWGICFRETDQVIGTFTLFHLETAHRRAEVGFALGRRWWGQGLASDALAAGIGFAFATLGLHRLEADADPMNARSLRLLERQGFRREGYLRERWHHLGQVQDAVFLGLLASEWLPPGVDLPPAPTA